MARSGISQVLVLRGIDPKEMFKKYIDGGFSKNSHEPVSIQKTKPIQFHNFNESDSSYTYKDITGKTIRIRTSGGITIDEPQFCLWCRISLEPDDILGLPIGLEKTEEKKYFNVTGRICSLRCGIAYDKLMRRLGIQTELFKNTESLLNLMYKELGGKSILKPAIGFWHLKSFGGSYSYEDFIKEDTEPLSTVNLKCYKMLHFCQK